MTPIRQVAIVGAGAMGAAYAAMFTDAGSFSVAFVARGERFERLKNRTITVNKRLYNVPVIHPDKVAHPADLILVALKHHHLAGAVGDLAALAGEDTVILSVMNGLESEETIGAVCGMDKLVYAVAVAIDAVREGHRFTYASPGKIIFGPVPGGGDGLRLERLREALDRAGIPYEVPPDIMRALWWKFMINVGINQASAVLRAPYGIFQSSIDARALMRSLMEEVVTLAGKAGIALTAEDVDAWDQILSGLSPAGKTSMLQDVEAGRKTEVEIFAGKVVALGRRYQVSTPVNATVQHIIKAIENRSGDGEPGTGRAIPSEPDG
jgi:2-dehydropantoate 2-reductase